MSLQVVSSAPVLRVRGLDFGFSGHCLFQNWNADFPTGLTLVEGGDGAGKTTLLRVLAGDCVPQAGMVTLLGIDSARQAVEYRTQVFWRDPRAPWGESFTAQAWVDEVAPRYPSWSGQDWQGHVDGFGLAAHLHKPMYQLSTGTQRKVQLAAALSSGAAMTLLDEPLAALDKPSIGHLLQALTAEATHPRGPGRAVIVAHFDALPAVPWHHRISLQSRDT